MKPESVVRRVKVAKSQLNLTVRETARLLGMRYSDVNAILIYPKKKIHPEVFDQAARVLSSFRRNPTSQFLRAVTKLAEAGASPKEIADLATKQAELAQVIAGMAGVKGSQS